MEQVRRSAGVGLASAVSAVLALFTFLNPVLAADDGVRMVRLQGQMINLLPLDVAFEMGYFDREGLRIELSSAQGGSEAAQMLLTGAADVGVFSVDHVFKAAAKGKRLVMVALLNRYPGFAIVVGSKWSDTVQTVSDLKGKKVAISGMGSATHLVAREVLRNAGVSEDQVAFIAMAMGGMAPALEHDEVQAAVVLEPLTSALVGSGKASLLVDLSKPEDCEKFYGGSYAQAGLIATPEFLQRNGPTLRKLVRALQGATAWMLGQDPEVLSRELPSTVVGQDRELFVTAFSRVKFLFPPDLTVTSEGMVHARDVMARYGVIPGDGSVVPTTLYDNSFLATDIPGAPSSGPAAGSEHRPLLTMTWLVASLAVLVAAVGIWFMMRRRARHGVPGGPRE